MASTPEKKVKLAVSKLLKAKGVYHFYPVTGGYGSSGVPDIVACARGRFIGIECKAAAGKASLLQAKKNPTCKSGTKLGVKSSVVFYLFV